MSVTDTPTRRSDHLTVSEFQELWDNPPYPAFRTSLVHQLEKGEITVEGMSDRGELNYSAIEFAVSEAQKDSIDFKLYARLVMFAIKTGIKVNFYDQTLVVELLSRPQSTNILQREPYSRRIEEFLGQFWTLVYDQRHERLQIDSSQVDLWYRAVLQNCKVLLLDYDGVDKERVLAIVTELLRDHRDAYEATRRLKPYHDRALFGGNEPKEPWSLSLVLRTSEHCALSGGSNRQVVWAKLFLSLKAKLGHFDNLRL